MSDRTRHATITGVISEFSQAFAAARSRWARSAEEVHPDLRGPGMILLQTILRKGPITATDLGSMLDIDKATVSRQISKLRSLDLVDAREAESDRRVILLTASKAAHEAIEAMQARISDDYLARFAEWSKEDLQQLESLLHRYNTSAEYPPHEGPARRCAREESEAAR